CPLDPRQDLDHLVLIYPVVVDVRLPSRRIDVEAREQNVIKPILALEAEQWVPNASPRGRATPATTPFAASVRRQYSGGLLWGWPVYASGGSRNSRLSSLIFSVREPSDTRQRSSRKLSISSPRAKMS